MSDLEISFCKIISKGLLLAFLYNVIKPKVLAFPVMFQVPDSTRIWIRLNPNIHETGSYANVYFHMVQKITENHTGNFCFHFPTCKYDEINQKEDV